MTTKTKTPSTYYVKCATQAERDALLDYAVGRGAEKFPKPTTSEETFVALGCLNEAKGQTVWSCYQPYDRTWTELTPDSFKRKVRKLWPKTPSTKTATTKRKVKPRKPSQLDRIEANISHIDRRTMEQGKVLDSICRSLAIDLGDRMKANTETLNRLHSDLSLIRSGMETRTEGSTAKVEVIAPKPAALQPGDYCQADEHHSLKEVAERLTAMGWEWNDRDRHKHQFIRLYSGVKEKHGRVMINMTLVNSGTRYPTPEFLSRAEVTAKELGLVPVVPGPFKEGDMIIRTKESRLLKVGDVGQIDELCDDGLHWCRFHFDPRRIASAKHHMRPATPAEVQAHQAAIAANEEAARVPKFGIGVECRGREYRIIADAADSMGMWPMYSGDARAVFHAKRHEFKIIP